MDRGVKRQSRRDTSERYGTLLVWGSTKTHKLPRDQSVGPAAENRNDPLRAAVCQPTDGRGGKAVVGAIANGGAADGPLLHAYSSGGVLKGVRGRDASESSLVACRRVSAARP
ncbi:hypothetical protein JTE90_022240 [Oedothorax gibbosus]|uniref:Uncharacterized protein n=1 Tax=Oedothorax gibbosus TaxID=931172 RepID=A0AAV6VWY9_9ARAC|nr:hypothetical protein JTE90_022240 [Oedothorax gibbosus]